MDGLDPHTGLVVRSDLCTGCAMCVLSCSSIKHDIYSFANAHSFIEISPRPSAAEFEVQFTSECDACLYCLKFCAFDAIAKPVGWVKAPHLVKIGREQRSLRRRDDTAATEAS